uniref:Serpentine receptor class gamma n=1 Tax=Panagrolaimus sp. ES5 TaxID=591445 RepID=A0AC34FJ70_9BILA
MTNSNFMSRFTQYEIVQPWIRSHPLYITICSLVSGYCVYSQAIYHAAIAVNRVWVSLFLIKGGNVKIEKFGNYFIWFLPILALILVSPRAAGTMVYTNDFEVLFAYYKETWVKTYRSIASPIIVLSSSSLSFILTLITIARYRYLFKQINGNNAAMKRDMYLLGHATVTLCFEILVGCYYVAVIISNIYDMPNLLAYSAYAVDYIIDLESVANPIALLIICKFVREDFQEFWFKKFKKDTPTKVVDISFSGNHLTIQP